MPVHSMHIFDRKGKTLFTRRFLKEAGDQTDTELLEEQRKLVFGMVFSLRDVVASLSPITSPPQPGAPAYSKSNTGSIASAHPDDNGLHSIQTGASTLYTYETPSGLRLALFITPVVLSLLKGYDGNNNNNLKSSGVNTGTSSSSSSSQQQQQQQQASLLKQQQRAKSIRLALKHIYHELWIQCVTRSPLYTPTEPNVEDTNFGQRLEAFLKAQTWY
jgi:trafficking protein particle complex subunit 1